MISLTGQASCGQLTSSIVEVGVEQALKKILRDVLSRNTGVVPGLDNSVDPILDNGLSDLSRRLIQDESEMILRQEGVSRVGSVPVVPDFVLIVRIDDSSGGSTEGRSRRTQERLDKWLESRDNEHRDRVGDLLDQARKSGNPVNSHLRCQLLFALARSPTSIFFITESRKLKIFQIVA